MAEGLSQHSFAGKDFKTCLQVKGRVGCCLKPFRIF